MAYSEQTDWSREDIRRRGLGLAIALLLEVIIILAILSLSMRSGGPAAGARGLSTFSLEAEAQSASSAEKSETETPVTKEQKSTITPPIPPPLLPPRGPLRIPVKTSSRPIEISAPLELVRHQRRKEHDVALERLARGQSRRASRSCPPFVSRAVRKMPKVACPLGLWLPQSDSSRVTASLRLLPSRGESWRD